MIKIAFVSNSENATAVGMNIFCSLENTQLISMKIFCPVTTSIFVASNEIWSAKKAQKPFVLGKVDILIPCPSQCLMPYSRSLRSNRNWILIPFPFTQTCVIFWRQHFSNKKLHFKFLNYALLGKRSWIIYLVISGALIGYFEIHWSFKNYMIQLWSIVGDRTGISFAEPNRTVPYRTKISRTVPNLLPNLGYFLSHIYFQFFVLKC